MPHTITFPISPDLKPGAPGKLGLVSLSDSFKVLAGVVPEANATSAPNLIGGYVDRWNGPMHMNGLIRAVHASFADHYPLTLSPDDIWLAIAQGFSAHVNANAEQLRQHFVKHEGQKYIEIQRNSFRKGSPDNDWPGGFAEFSDKIAEHIGKKRDLLVSSFSTTGPLEKTVSEVVLMDTLQQYFSFGCRTLCGIPSLTLLGSVSDWENIRERARALSEFECKPWIDALVPVLDRFIDVFAGNADPKFWGSFYKQGGGSGGPYVTGAINVFFPYVIGRTLSKADTQNKATFGWADRLGGMCGGPTPDAFPKGIAKVPFKWHYFQETYPMQFLGGFVGATQDPDTLAVRPALGWGIADEKGADHPDEDADDLDEDAE